MHVRVAPEALSRGLIAGLAVCWLATGCLREGADVRIAWHIQPTPPVTGRDTTVRLTLLDARGQPLRGATVRLEGHMTHPGMAPLTSALVEGDAGSYEGRLHLTMTGDWVLVVTGTLADGRRFIRQTEVAAVAPDR